MTYTVDDIMAIRPCYPRERVTALWAGRAAITPLELLDLPIPPADVLWAAWRIWPEPARTVALTATVARAVTNHALHCGVPAVEDWAESWLDGTDRTEASARAAVLSSRAEAAEAAWVSAEAASAEAAWVSGAAEAAWVAGAAEAAWASASGVAAGAAERLAQLADLRAALTVEP